MELQHIEQAPEFLLECSITLLMSYVLRRMPGYPHRGMTSRVGMTSKAAGAISREFDYMRLRRMPGFPPSRE